MNPVTNEIKKTHNLVRFPLQGLDLSMLSSPIRIDPSDTSSPIYDIFAVVNHHGPFGTGIYMSHNPGHYTAYVDYGDALWYRKDDSRVSPVSSKRIISADAYMLLYKRRKAGEVPLPYLEPSPATISKFQAPLRVDHTNLSPETSWAKVNPLLGLRGSTALEKLAELEQLRENWKVERLERVKKMEQEEAVRAKQALAKEMIGEVVSDTPEVTWGDLL